jgi:hypothetical protein
MHAVADEHVSPKRGRSGSGGHVGGKDVIGVAVELVACSVISHGGAGVGVPCGDLHIAQVDAGVQHRGDERVAEHVRMQFRHSGDGIGESAKPAGRRMPIHPRSATVQQDRPAQPISDGTVDRSPDRRRQRH